MCDRSYCLEYASRACIDALCHSSCISFLCSPLSKTRLVPNLRAYALFKQSFKISYLIGSYYHPTDLWLRQIILVVVIFHRNSWIISLTIYTMTHLRWVTVLAYVEDGYPQAVFTFSQRSISKQHQPITDLQFLKNAVKNFTQSSSSPQKSYTTSENLKFAKDRLIIITIIILNFHRRHG